MSEAVSLGQSLRQTYENFSLDNLFTIAMNQVARKDGESKSLGVIIDILHKDRGSLYILDDKVKENGGEDEIAFYRAQRRRALGSKK